MFTTILFIVLSGVRLSPLGPVARTLRKPAPVPLRPPQIPLDQTRARAAAVGIQRLTA
jgi:hypothetical protein